MNEKYYVYYEDPATDGFSRALKKEDKKFSTYNPGTQLILDLLEEQGHEFNDFEDYLGLVESLEKCRDEDDVEDVMYGVGTDYIDEMEVHIMWMDLMYPRPQKSPFIDYDN
tara:strand:- start:244 stop:576 length:333 start_codon:yes stop_codon:yes gene_type:complete